MGSVLDGFEDQSYKLTHVVQLYNFLYQKRKEFFMPRIEKMTISFSESKNHDSYSKDLLDCGALIIKKNMLDGGYCHIEISVKEKREFYRMFNKTKSRNFCS